MNFEKVLCLDNLLDINLHNELVNNSIYTVIATQKEYKRVSFFVNHEMKNSIFFCITYYNWSGFNYIENAIKCGAQAIVMTHNQYEEYKNKFKYEAINIYIVLDIEKIVGDLILLRRKKKQGKSCLYFGKLRKITIKNSFTSYI